MEERVNSLKDFITKYGFVGSLAIIVPFVMPYVNEYLDDKQEKMIVRLLDQNRQTIFKEVNKVADNIMSSNVMAHKTAVLDPEDAIYLMRTAVGYQSIHKVNWLRELLEDNENTFTNHDFIKTKIKLELIRQSAIYVTALNRFSSPHLNSLGDFVATEFPMAEFLHSIYAIVLDDTPTIEEKLEYVMQTMLTMQEDLWKVAQERVK